MLSQSSLSDGDWAGRLTPYSILSPGVSPRSFSSPIGAYPQKNHPCSRLWKTGVSPVLAKARAPHKASMAAQTQYFEPSHSASLKVGLNVSRVKESDAHEETRPRERPQLPQAECTLGVQADRVMLAPGWMQLALTIPSAKNSAGIFFSQAGQPCPPSPTQCHRCPSPEGPGPFAESLWLCFLGWSCSAAASAAGQHMTCLPLSGFSESQEGDLVVIKPPCYSSSLPRPFSYFRLFSLGTTEVSVTQLYFRVWPDSLGICLECGNGDREGAQRLRPPNLEPT
jgi:hypothetical protein